MAKTEELLLEASTPELALPAPEPEAALPAGPNLTLLPTESLRAIVKKRLPEEAKEKVQDVIDARKAA